MKNNIEAGRVSDERLDVLMEHHQLQMDMADNELHGGAEHDEDDREFWLAEKQTVDAIRELLAARAEIARLTGELDHYNKLTQCYRLEELWLTNGDLHKQLTALTGEREVSSGTSDKRTWQAKASARVAETKRIAVGSDVHLLEMALAERKILTGERERLTGTGHAFAYAVQVVIHAQTNKTIDIVGLDKMKAQKAALDEFRKALPPKPTPAASDSTPRAPGLCLDSGEFVPAGEIERGVACPRCAGTLRVQLMGNLVCDNCRRAP